eukprot:1013369-Prymnesium_polylepis.1
MPFPSHSKTANGPNGSANGAESRRPPAVPAAQAGPKLWTCGAVVVGHAEMWDTQSVRHAEIARARPRQASGPRRKSRAPGPADQLLVAGGRLVGVRVARHLIERTERLGCRIVRERVREGRQRIEAGGEQQPKRVAGKELRLRA